MDVRESFPTLEIEDGAGAALAAKEEGDAPTGFGSIALAFKDNSGNLALPQLDAMGRLPVSTAAAGTDLDARGTVAGDNSTFVDVAVISLTVDKMYKGLEFLVSCFRDAIFQIVHNNNGTPTILADAQVGPGTLSFHAVLSKLQFTAGSTGTQELKVQAKNLNVESDFRATIAITEVT